MYKFDDYLDLIPRDFSWYKYIIFTWVSGSGKSSYINELIARNKTLDKNICVIDEITHMEDFLRYILRLCSPWKYIVASHIHPYCFFVYRIFWKILYIQTDENSEKMKKYLTSKWMSFSQEILEKYMSMLGANYTDVDIILESYEWDSFDEAFQEFFLFSSIKRGRKNIVY